MVNCVINGFWRVISYESEEISKNLPCHQEEDPLGPSAKGPCSTPISKAIQNILSERSSEGVDWMKWYNHVSQAKNLYVKLIDADLEEMAMVPNTSTGVSLAAEIACAGRNRLRKNRIAVSSRGGGARVSPHFYNTIEELDSSLTVPRTK